MKKKKKRGGAHKDMDTCDSYLKKKKKKKSSANGEESIGCHNYTYSTTLNYRWCTWNKKASWPQNVNSELFERERRLVLKEALSFTYLKVREGRYESVIERVGSHHAGGGVQGSGNVRHTLI